MFEFAKHLSLTDFDEVNPSYLRIDRTQTFPYPCCNFVIFYKETCGYCIKDEHLFEKLIKIAAFADFYAVECSSGEGLEIRNSIKAITPGLVPTVPSLVMYCNGVPTTNFQGERSVENLMNFTMKCKESS